MDTRLPAWASGKDGAGVGGGERERPEETPGPAVVLAGLGACLGVPSIWSKTQEGQEHSAGPTGCPRTWLYTLIVSGSRLKIPALS